MQNIEFEHIFNKLKTETSKMYKIEKGLLYKNVNNSYKLMLPHQISLDFFKQCHSNNLHMLPKDLENYMQTFWYDKYNEKIAKQECLVCQITPNLRPKHFK